MSAKSKPLQSRLRVKIPGQARGGVGMCGGQGVSNHNVSSLILHPLNPNSLVSHNSAIVGTDILIYIYF